MCCWRCLNGKNRKDRKREEPTASRFFYLNPNIMEVRMATRGVRGATTIDFDDNGEMVLERTKELLQAIMNANPTMNTTDIASALFTVTDDIHSVFPALAAREMGWEQVPLMCAQEISVQNSMPFCIRVLLHWNTDIQQNQINHIYLHRAEKLRPDLTINNDFIQM